MFFWIKHTNISSIITLCRASFFTTRFNVDDDVIAELGFQLDVTNLDFVGAVDGEELEVCHVLEVGDSFLVVVNTSLHLSLDQAAQHRNYGLRFNYEPVLNFSLELEKILEKGSVNRQEHTFVTCTTVNQYIDYLAPCIICIQFGPESCF